MKRTIAIIGSFRQHYKDVLNAWRIFTEGGLEVTSPKGTPILEEGIPFVRFESDSVDADDETVQSIALHRILRALAVYVVAPRGYVGRTTCYELGRIIQAKKPVYFSEAPHDLPVRIPISHILEPIEVVKLYDRGASSLEWPFATGIDRYSDLERLLVDGIYSEE